MQNPLILKGGTQGVMIKLKRGRYYSPNAPGIKGAGLRYRVLSLSKSVQWHKKNESVLPTLFQYQDPDPEQSHPHTKPHVKTPPAWCKMRPL
jgi:hypothetical protein